VAWAGRADGVGHGFRGLAQRCVDDLGTHAYDYDDLYRITDVTYPGPDDVDYTYDAVGNRLTQNSTSYTYDDANQLTSAGGVSFDYDGNGNQTDRGADTFDWDHENRLTDATIASTTWSHEYNGDGVRMSRGDGTTTVDYVWDIAGGLPMLLQDGTNTYVYGLGLVSVYDAVT